MEENLEDNIHYIFGYGSLINKNSRGITGITFESYYVHVHGLERFWMNHHGMICPVGVIPSSDSVCNGVLVRVPANELPNFDKREGKYERKPIDLNQIDFLDEKISLPPNAKVWGYMALYKDPPSNETPIYHSYLDVILEGCLQDSEESARFFLQNTFNWGPLVNDRECPKYIRAMKECKSAEIIDKLLKEIVPEVFSNRITINSKKEEL